MNSDDKLTQITKAASELKSLNQEIALLDKTIDAKLAVAKEIEERTLPMLMNDLHIKEIRLQSGEKLSISDIYFASVSQERMDAAYEWLKEHKMEAIVDETISVAGDEESVGAAARALAEKEIEFARVKKIHPSRLKAFVKERMTDEAELQNPTFPQKLFGVSVVQKATIK